MKYVTNARQIGHRLTVAWLSLSVFLVTFLEPDSLRGQIVKDSGIIGTAVAASLAIIAVITLVDVVVNDVLSERYTLQVTQTARMHLYMVQAVLNMAVVGTAVMAGIFSWVLCTYLVLALASVWIAVFDVWHRYVSPRLRHQ